MSSAKSSENMECQNTDMGYYIFLTSFVYNLKSMEILTGRQSINKQQLSSHRGKLVAGTLLPLLMQHGHFI